MSGEPAKARFSRWGGSDARIAADRCARSVASLHQAPVAECFAGERQEQKWKGKTRDLLVEKLTELIVDRLPST